MKKAKIHIYQSTQSKRLHCLSKNPNQPRKTFSLQKLIHGV
jgi:hypothetical protein